MSNLWETHANLFDDAEQVIIEDAGLLHSKPDTFGKSPAPLIHDKNITDGACRLYAHMHWRYGRNQKNFEGRGSIAEFLGVSKTTITNRIKELEAADWIVVVERRKTGDASNFQTPFYHVFETQADARNFRKHFKPRSGQALRDKPEQVVRKTRKGKGGNPKRKATASTQVEPDTRVNSGSHGSPVTRVNSGSHYPDSVSYPDSESLTPDGGWQIKDIVQFVEQRGKTTYSTLVATFGREAQLEIQKLVRDGKLKDDFDGYSIPTGSDEQPSPVDDYLATQVEPPNEYDLLLERVEHHFAVSGLYSKDMTAMLRGTSDTGDWKANNLKTPVTADEFDDWVDYYKTKQRPGASLPQNPEKLAGYVNGWVKLGKPKRLFHSSTRVATPLAPPPALNDSDRAALSEQIRAMKEGIAANG